MQKINRVSLRHERKKYSQLRKVSNHNNRSGDYSKDHIDESKIHLNRALYRKHSNANSLIEQLNMTIEQIPEDLQPKINKNTHSQNESVVVMELILSASPEWFESASPEQFENWVKLNEQAIKKRFGDNLLTVDLHLDEKTPHFHICTMPLELTQKKKRMSKQQKAAGKEPEYYEQYNFNAKNLFNNKALELNQTYFANAVKPLNLERGVRNSKAKRTSLKEYHDRIKNELAKAESEISDFRDELKKHKLPNPEGNKYIKKTILSKVVDYAKYINDVRKSFKRLKSFKLDAFREIQESLVFLRAEREKHLNTILELNRIADNDHENLSTKFEQMQKELDRLKGIDKKLYLSEEQNQVLTGELEQEIDRNNDLTQELYKTNRKPEDDHDVHLRR